jgi:CheY-like chemotaxis protein
MQVPERRLLILIADDNRDLAKGLSILLTLRGFDVEIIHDGREVLKTARARRPDAFLLDISLPGIDGCQVAAQIRADEQFNDSLLIAISAYDEFLLDDSAPLAAFDHHFAKPVDFKAVLTLLASHSRSVARAPQ